MARADSVGKDRDTKDTTSAADRASSGKGGYSGAGGMDSPSERGPGPGGKGGGSTTGGGSSYSGQGRGQDSPSEGGPGRGVSGSSASTDRNGGEGSRYSGRGGLNSPGEVARAADGFGLNGSSVDAPKSYDYSSLGKVGAGGLYSTAMGGPGAPLAGSTGSYTTARGLMSATEPSASMTSFRQAEIASMDALSDYGKEVVGVVGSGPGWTTVELRDGTVERRDGTRASRNNNPGNIEFGPYSRSKGAVGTDGRFAVFSTPQQGVQAMKDLVFGPNYAGKTIEQAIEKYAPEFENDSKAYAATVAGAAGVPVDTPTSSLSDVQKDKMIEAMTHVEGGKPYDAATISGGNWGTEGYSGKSSGNSSVASAAASPQPVDRNVAAYRDYGKSRAAAPTSMPSWDARAQRFRDLYISPNYSLEQQGLTQAYADSVTPEVDRAPPATTPTGTAAAPAVTQSSTAAPAGSSATVAPTVTSGTPVQPNASTGTPAQPVQTQPETVTPNRQRGTGAQIAATGIDVLAGLAPGVGTAASVFNAGSALLGGRTIGERIVDDFLSGDNPGRAPTSREGDSLIQRDKLDGGSSSDPASVPTANAEEKTKRFARLYLKTPTEKWGASRGLMTAAG